MAFFTDTFTEASNTNLESHTPDAGTSWTRLYTDLSTLNMYVDGTTDTLRCENNSADQGVFYTADVTYPTANYYIQVTFTDDGNATYLKWYWLLRVQDVDNLYAFVITQGTGASKFYKKVSGTWSAIGSGKTMLTDFVNGDVLKVEINDSTLKFYVNGVESISTTDSDIAAAGKAGCASGGGPEAIDSGDDATTDWQWDAFSLTDLGAAAGNVARSYRMMQGIGR